MEVEKRGNAGNWILQKSSNTRRKPFGIEDMDSATLREDYARKGGMPLRILVADDHPVVRQGLRTLLRGNPDWEVIDEAEDGVEAVEKANQLKPDVVVLDLSMPRMNGLEACRKIRKNLPQSEILIVTQHDSPQMMREAFNANAKGYVVKSDVGRDLLAAVDAVSQHKFFGRSA